MDMYSCDIFARSPTIAIHIAAFIVRGVFSAARRINS